MTQTAQQRAELSVAGWLADSGYPVVAPSPLVPREPVRRQGFSMTFWQYVEEVPDAEPDVVRRCEMTARLHFELVTQGPAESDLTMAGSDGIAAYNEAAARLGLRLLDERLLRVTEAAGMLGVVACLAMAPELPLLVDGVKTVLDRWRDGPSIADVLPGTRGGRR